MKRHIILVVILTTILYSCQDNNQPTADDKTTFTISPTQRNIVQGNKDGILIIPKDCFVDEQGNIISEEVKVEFTEAYSLSDILENNLDTRTKEGLLVTGGMVNLEATTLSGQKVQIATNKSITFQKAETLGDTNNYQFFSQEDELWANPKPPNPYLTYLPIEKQAMTYFYLKKDTNGNWVGNSQLLSKKTLNKEGYELYDSSSFSLMITSERSKHLFKDLGLILEKETLDKSFIASKEYEDRFLAFPPSGEMYYDVHHFYLENLDNPLWVVDSLLLEKTKEAVLYEKENYPDSYNRNKEWTLRYLRTITKFKNQRKTTFPPDRFSEEDLLKLEKSYKEIAANRSIQSFSIRKTGWHNIDYFYKKNSLQKTKLQVKSSHKLNRLLLVFKEDKVVLQKTFDKEPSLYSLSADGFIKAPPAKAYLLGLYTDGDKVLFAKKEIQIGVNDIEELELKPSSNQEVADALKSIEDGYK